MSDSDQMELLQAIDTKLRALIAIHTHKLLTEDPDLASPRPRSIDKMLHDIGLNQAEIAEILGKSRQAVGQILRKEKG